MAPSTQEAKAANARIQVPQEVSKTWGPEWKLCFQLCRYVYDKGGLEEGYRFI